MVPVEQQNGKHAHQGEDDQKEDGEYQVPDPGAVRPDGAFGYKMLQYIHDIDF